MKLVLQRIHVGDDSIWLVRLEENIFVPIIRISKNTGKSFDLATKSDLHLPNLPSLIEDLLQLQNLVSRAKFLHLTIFKDKLEKAFEEDSSRIEILLESQDKYKEKLCILTQKIKKLQEETEQGAEIEAIKATVKIDQEASQCLTPKLESFVVLLDPAEA